MALTEPPKLRATNAVVGVVHLAQAIAVLWLANDFAVPVTASFLDGPPGTPGGDAVTLFEVRFGWAIAAFLLLVAMILFGHRMERVNDGSRPTDWQPFWFGCIAGTSPGWR